MKLSRDNEMTDVSFIIPCATGKCNERTLEKLDCTKNDYLVSYLHDYVFKIIISLLVCKLIPSLPSYIQLIMLFAYSDIIIFIAHHKFTNCSLEKCN